MPGKTLVRLAVVMGMAAIPQAGLADDGPAVPKDPDCGAVIARLKKDFAAEPGRLILAVEDAVTTKGACVCRILRTAVDLAGHDPVLTGKLVIAAIRIDPASAAGITECALAAAPEAAAAIRAEITRELGGNAGAFPESVPAKTETVPPGEVTPAAAPTAASQTEPRASGKGTVPPADSAGSPDAESEIREFPEWPAVTGSGVYLLPGPARQSSSSGGITTFGTTKVVVTTRFSRPKRPVSPVTRANPE